MRITKNQLRQIIKEELAGVLDEETAIGDPTAGMSNKLNLNRGMSKIQDTAADKKDAKVAKDWAPIDQLFGDAFQDKADEKVADKWSFTDEMFGDSGTGAKAKKVKESRRRKVRKTRKK